MNPPANSPAWLTADQAIGLVAFGRPLFDAELAAAVDPPPTHPWGSSDWGALLDALQSRAAGKIWRPTDWEPAFGAWRIRARARRVMRATGLDAGRLAEDLAADIARRDEAQRRVADAVTRLVEAAREGGKLRVEGRRGSRHSREMAELHEPIEPRAFLRTHITITGDGWVTVDPAAPIGEWLHRREAGAVDWGDLRLKTEDVAALVPRPAVIAAAEPQRPRAEALPPFVYSEAMGSLLAVASRGQAIMTRKEIEAWVKTRFATSPTDREYRALMKAWKNRRRGPPRRNLPKLGQLEPIKRRKV